MSKFEITKTVRTYEQLLWWCRNFYSDDGPRFLIIIGNPGLSKSQTFLRAAPEGTLFLSGALSAFHLYIQLFEFCDRPVVIDDVDGLFKEKASINLLKTLGNTDSKRTIYWGKEAKQLAEQGVPHRFETTSRLCILANTLTHVEENLAAVLDRAFVLSFQPSAAELHREVGKWFTDAEIYEFVGRHLPLVMKPTMRAYTKAAEMKQMAGDWRELLLEQWATSDPQLVWVATILNDASLTTTRQRIARFKQLGGGSRATYMRHQQRYRDILDTNTGGSSEA